MTNDYQSYLPEEFEFSHEFCFFLHDQMVETLKSSDKGNIFNSLIKLKKGHRNNEITGMSGGELNPDNSWGE